MLLDTIRVDVSKQENEFQYSIPFYDCSDINFKASGIKAVLNSLGSVEINSVPCSIAYKPSKHTQAQILPDYEKIPTKFKLKNEFKVPFSDGRIASIAVTNKALLLWSEKGSHIQDSKLTAPAWGIAIIPGTDQAVVTLPSINSIQFVNITNMVPGKVIKDLGKSYGITVARDMIVLAGAGNVYFLSMTGNLMKKINVGKGYLYSLKANKMDMIYCCESGNDTLHCIDINGTVIFSYTVSSDFNEPIDMALDGKQNLYITTCRSNKLHRLSKDGKLIDILLKKEDGLNEPYAVAFNKNYTKLYIVNGHYWQNKQVSIFE